MEEIKQEQTTSQTPQATEPKENQSQLNPKTVSEIKEEIVDDRPENIIPTDTPKTARKSTKKENKNVVNKLVEDAVDPIDAFIKGAEPDKLYMDKDIDLTSVAEEMEKSQSFMIEVDNKLMAIAEKFGTTIEDYSESIYFNFCNLLTYRYELMNIRSRCLIAVATKNCTFNPFLPLIHGLEVKPQLKASDIINPIGALLDDEIKVTEAQTETVEKIEVTANESEQTKEEVKPEPIPEAPKPPAIEIQYMEYLVNETQTKMPWKPEFTIKVGQEVGWRDKRVNQAYIRRVSNIVDIDLSKNPNDRGHALTKFPVVIMLSGLGEQRFSWDEIISDPTGLPEAPDQPQGAASVATETKPTYKIGSLPHIDKWINEEPRDPALFEAYKKELNTKLGGLLSSVGFDKNKLTPEDAKQYDEFLGYIHSIASVKLSSDANAAAAKTSTTVSANPTPASQQTQQNQNPMIRKGQMGWERAVDRPKVLTPAEELDSYGLSLYENLTIKNNQYGRFGKIELKTLNKHLMECSNRYSYTIKHIENSIEVQFELSCTDASGKLCTYTSPVFNAV